MVAYEPSRLARPVPSWNRRNRRSGLVMAKEVVTVGDCSAFLTDLVLAIIGDEHELKREL